MNKASRLPCPIEQAVGHAISSIRCLVNPVQRVVGYRQQRRALRISGPMVLGE